MIEAQERRGLVDAFRAADKAGVSIPANITPSAHCAMASLTAFDEYPLTLRSGRQGRDKAARAITALLRDGMLIEEEYRKPNRHLARRYRLAECVDTSAQEANSGPEQRVE